MQKIELVEIDHINKEDLFYIEDINWKEAKKQKELFSKDSLCVSIIDEWIEDCQKYLNMNANKNTYELFQFITLCMLVVFLAELISSTLDNYPFLFIGIYSLLLMVSITLYIYISIQLKKYKQLVRESYQFNLYLPPYEKEYLNLYLLENVKRYDVKLNGILQGKAYVCIYDYALTIELYNMNPEVAKRIEDSGYIPVLEFLTLHSGVLKRYMKLDLN